MEKIHYIKHYDNILTKAADTAIHWLFPMATYCLCCGKYINSSRSYCICDHCIRHINWGHVEIDLRKEGHRLGRPSCLDSARGCMKYGLYERRLIFDLKYDGRTYVSRAIAAIMYDRIMSDPAALSQLAKADLIVPVPMFKEKEKERGFNQAAKMARHLASYMKKQQCSDMLLRRRATAAQRSITGAERYANMEGAFWVNPRREGDLKGKTVILVDDVYTSGATAHHCGAALKKAGAAEVHFLGLATANVFAHGYFGLAKIQINS
ncbi:MAG: ComF family protein [Firmicutes bacterium]|nr:ComF family protein [Bacillota bacterium]